MGSHGGSIRLCSNDLEWREGQFFQTDLLNNADTFDLERKHNTRGEGRVTRVSHAPTAILGVPSIYAYPL